MPHAAAIADIRQLCQRYNSPASEPGTHALAYKVLAIMQRHGVLEQPQQHVTEPTDLNMTPTDRTEANVKEEKGCEAE